jgi:hypothetical protein
MTTARVIPAKRSDERESGRLDDAGFWAGFLLFAAAARE